MSEHPDWALAYILVDWKHQQSVRKAYAETCKHGPEDPYAIELLQEALRKLRVYVAALEEVTPP